MTTTRRGRLVIAIAAVAVAGLAAGGILLWQVFAADAPAPAHLSEPSLSAAGSSEEAGSTASGLEGTWSVDATSGSLADGTSTFAGYRVEEQLSGLGANEAVGRTQHVRGSMKIDGTAITDLSITVDMTTLQSDDARRDNSLRSRGLQTDLYPTATFELTEPIEVGSVPHLGQRVKLNAVGDLTLHSVTERVEVPVTAQVTSRGIEAVADLDVAFAGYRVEPPPGSWCCRSRRPARSSCTCSSPEGELDGNAERVLSFLPGNGVALRVSGRSTSRSRRSAGAAPGEQEVRRWVATGRASPTGRTCTTDGGARTWSGRCCSSS